MMKIYSISLRVSILLMLLGGGVGLNGALHAQSKTWEIDRIQQQQLEDAQALDSILVHMKGNFEIKLGYGRWFFNASDKLEGEDIFRLPNRLTTWQIGTTWHFREHLFTELLIGFQLKRDVPPNPDFLSVLNGDDIELEGSGSLLLPVEAGLSYYFTEKRFRPLVGISTGIVFAQTRYTVAEGNIIDGITRTDTQLKDRAWFGKLRVGFDYRFSRRLNFQMNCAYTLSSPFGDAFGGYEQYNGFQFGIGIAVLTWPRRKKK